MKYRRAARVDSNQSDIVKDLRKIPGVTVEPGHDDILVGFRGKTYWVEIKDPAKTLKKNGELKDGALKNSQEKLKAEWTGNYIIAWSLDQILEEIGITNNSTRR